VIALLIVYFGTALMFVVGLLFLAVTVFLIFNEQPKYKAIVAEKPMVPVRCFGFALVFFYCAYAVALFGCAA
jgi:hypothetical protein